MQRTRMAPSEIRETVLRYAEMMGREVSPKARLSLDNLTTCAKLGDAVAKRLKALGIPEEEALDCILAYSDVLVNDWHGIPGMADRAVKRYTEGGGRTRMRLLKERAKAKAMEDVPPAREAAPKVRVPEPEGPCPEEREHAAPAAPDGGFIRTRAYDDLVALLRMRRNVALVGPTGCGKTDMAVRAAMEVVGGCTVTTAPQTAYDLIGFTDANGVYREMPFTEAAMHGKVGIVDEADRMGIDADVAVNAPVANRTIWIRGMGQVAVHPDFLMVATMNTPGFGQTSDYISAQEMDESWRNRLVFLEVDFDPGVDSAMAGGDRELLAFAESWRSSVSEARIPHAACSYRSIRDMRELEPAFGTRRALRMGLTKGLPGTTLSTIVSGMGAPEGNRWKRELRALAEELCSQGL